ncbi:MAG TPA: hypothetical protein VIY52_30445 [Streptosporangiaceae bacterium]
MPDPARRPDAGGLTAGELERARRELAASLALARPGSPARGLIAGHLSAIDAELAVRRVPGQPVIYLCSCGFGTDDPGWLDGHLSEHPEHPGHHRRSRASEVTS